MIPCACTCPSFYPIPAVSAMSVSKLLLTCWAFLLIRAASVASQDVGGFSFNGFQSAVLNLGGKATVTSSGLLRLTDSEQLLAGHAFYPLAFNFDNASSNPNSTNSSSTAFSFSTTFVFTIISDAKYAAGSGHGIAFTVSPIPRGLTGASASAYLGLFDQENNGKSSNHVFAVELDTFQNPEFGDIDSNHVGIDINDLRSVASASAGYYDDSADGDFTNISLTSGKPIQAWVEYDSSLKRIDVTLAPIRVAKPRTPLVSLPYDLSPVVNEFMYVGFSASTGTYRAASHYILGWSFAVGGQQPKELDISHLPLLSRQQGKELASKFLRIGFPVIVVGVVLALVFGAILYSVRKRRFVEVVEDWEADLGGPHRFKYDDLHFATKGFRDEKLLGRGGFGDVYKGVLPNSQIEVAVKRISHESKQGMREFLAEIASIGRMKHRNLVTLLGYCRRDGELLLVYDYMPNGSLDKYLYDQPPKTLNWNQRFRVVKGVASGLLYLHEEWEKVVVHRDVKASNVLLDSEMNGRLGDFGLARSYDHGKIPPTTRVGGTLGYLAPEYSRTGKATTSTDVYAYGAFLLEVACGKRPVEMREHDLVLVDWVHSFWSRGALLEARDPNMGSDYIAEEVELVLKLGLMCSVSEPRHRPSMRQVVKFLEKDAPLPYISSLWISANGLNYAHSDGYAELLYCSSISDSILSEGR